MSNTTLTIRYTGPDNARRYLIQRMDRQFWTGNGWSAILDNAKLFTDHKSAQATATAIQYGRHKGKPIRKFKIEVEVTLADDNVDAIETRDLVNFIAEAARIDIDTGVHGEGPKNSFVILSMKPATMTEVETTRKTL